MESRVIAETKIEAEPVDDRSGCHGFNLSQRGEVAKDF